MILLTGLKRVNDEKGFTLIEILLVTVLLVVITGLTAVNFKSSFSGIQLNRTVEDLRHLMRYAQSRSVIKQSMIILEFDDTSKSYRLKQQVEDQQSQSSPPVFERISERVGRDYQIPETISIVENPEKIVFYPDGRIAKERFSVCGEKKCFVFSTKEQRGKVLVFEESEEN